MQTQGILTKTSPETYEGEISTITYEEPFWVLRNTSGEFLGLSFWLDDLAKRFSLELVE